MFKLIFVLLLAGLIALAFYLGWVHIATNTTTDQSESSVTLSINKAKINESVGALKNKVAPQSPDKSKAVAETTVQGKVQAIGPAEIKVATGTDQGITHAIARETDMRGDPRPGDAVTVTYMTVDNRHV